MILTPTAAVNAAVAQARNLPGLIANLQQINPSLVQQLTAKPLLASRTVWGTLLAWGIGWLTTRYGLAWPTETCGLVAGACMWAASIALRWITKGPVAGIVRTPAGVPPDGVPPA